jgi:hypothetical protein
LLELLGLLAQLVLVQLAQADLAQLELLDNPELEYKEQWGQLV